MMIKTSIFYSATGLPIHGQSRPGARVLARSRRFRFRSAYGHYRRLPAEHARKESSLEGGLLGCDTADD